MEPPCTQCDRPDNSLLRVVLIGEIVRADESTLAVLAEVFQALGLLEPGEEEGAATHLIETSKPLLRLLK